MSRLRARFRIPTYDEISLGEKPAPDIPFSQSNGQSNGGLAPEPSPPLPERQTAAARDRAEQAWEEEVMPATVWSVAAGTALADQPVATLFARLWTTRPKSARIELQFATAKRSSSSNSWLPCPNRAMAYSAWRAPDSTYTLMAIAWDTIARILVCGLLELPK